MPPRTVVLVKGKSRRRSTAQKAQLALTKVNKLQRSIEMKHSDTAATANVLDAGLEVRFDSIAQGDTEVTRTGTRITPKGLQVRYRVDFEPASTSSAQSIRLIYVQSKTVEAQATPQLEDIIDVSTSTLETNSLYTWELSKTYRILKDVTHEMSEIAGSPFQISRSFRIPAKKLKQIRYTPGASTIEFGNIGVIVISNAAASGPIVTIAARLLFTDL